MINIVALHGTGDIYLLCALFDAFQRTHNRDAKLVIREKYRCIAEMFPGVRFIMDDQLVNKGEADLVMQRDYDNVLVDGRCFFAHPTFLRTNVRIDHLTTKPDVSQADLYKCLLRINPDVPLALPTIKHPETKRGMAVIIPEARSWPNLHPDFWTNLSQRLSFAGWNVQNNKNSGWSLPELFRRCGEAEWVIGPQCGVMSILVTGRFPCRKTLATSDVDGRWLFSQRTFPYAYVTKFSNQDYDVEEFKIGDANQEHLIDAIAGGANALRLRPHDPAPVLSVSVPLSPGDFLDRYAVLLVKRGRFPPEKRAAIEREFQRHAEQAIPLLSTAGLPELFDELAATHAAAFDVLERAVPSALESGTMEVEDHVAAIRLNRARVEIKRKIDATMRGPYGGGEVKSYYGDEK